jgi:hypothetical protein
LFKGSCLCGGVKYEIKGEPIIVAHCHCIDCQKRSGAGHSTGAMFLEENFDVKGSPSKFNYVDTGGKTTTHFFCAHCGSPLFGKNTTMPGVMTVSAGTLELPNSIEPQVAVCAKYKNHWDAMDDSLETFDDMPDWKPEFGA